MYALDIGAVIARSERCFKVDIILSADALQNIEYRLSLGKLNCDGAEHNSVRRQNVKLCRVKVGEIVKYRCAVDRYRAVQLFSRINIRFVGLDRLGLACRHRVGTVLVLLGSASVGEICCIARFGCRLDLIGDVIESQFKTAYNPNLGAALSLILMVMIFICIGVMNRFGDEEEEVVTL